MVYGHVSDAGSGRSTILPLRRDDSMEKWKLCPPRYMPADPTFSFDPLFDQSTTMTSCAVARANSPAPDELECVDMLHPLSSDNNLPLISTTPMMPPVIKTTDRPVVLCMAPVHKLHHEDDTGDDKEVRDAVGGIQLN
ncbi:hypothetical protein COOONC_01035 [Cooperia oncophora]